jgi:MFS family permease
VEKVKVNKKRRLGKAWIFWVMSGVFYLYEMILRASPGVMANDLRADFGLSPQELGFLSSMYYWAYTPLQIPCGLILDKIGSRKLITGSCVLCAISAGIFGWTESLWVAHIARFLMGAGSACAFISALALSSGWFPASYFGVMAGLTNLLGCFGGIFAGEPLALLSARVGWRQAMMHLSWIGLVLSILTWLCIRDPEVAETSPESPNHLWSRLKRVIHRPQIWLTGIVGGLLYLPISAFAELWAIPFLQSSCSIDEKTASFATMSLYLMSGIGGPVLAALATRWRSYTKILKMVAIVECALFAAMAMAHLLPYGMIIGVASLIGLILGGQVLVFSVVKGQCKADELGSAYAFVNALVMGCGLIFQPLLGKILQAWWMVLGGQYKDDNPDYTAGIYAIVPVALMVAFFLGWLMIYWMRDTYAKQHVSEKQ